MKLGSFANFFVLPKYLTLHLLRICFNSKTTGRVGLFQGILVKKEMNKVLILSYNRAIQKSLQHLLSRLESVEVEGYSGESFSSFSLPEGHYDLLIVDFSEGKSNTIRTLKQLRTNFPNLPILAMGEYNESEFSQAILNAGASKYLSINTSGEQIHRAVSDVCRRALS